MGHKGGKKRIIFQNPHKSQDAYKKKKRDGKPNNNNKPRKALTSYI